MANVDIRRLQILRTNKGNNLWTLKDYCWFEPNNQVFNNFEEVQTIILDEFQVEPMFDYIKVLNSLINSGKDDSKNAQERSKQKGNGLGKILSQSTTYVVEEQLFKRYLKNETAPTELPIRLIENLFAGRFLNRFIFPFLNNNEYLKADPGSWNTQESINSFMKSLNEYINNTNIDMPLLPTWNLNNSGTRTIDFKFSLLNTTTDNLVNNFKLLHSFIAGAFWLQMDVMMRPPNIYRVFVPGRFMMLWATAEVNITMRGHLRRNSEAVNKILSASNNILKQINENTLFPDAYEVNIKLRDLLNTINNYNTYMYFMTKADITNISTTGPGRERQTRNKLGGIFDITKTWLGFK